jgi:4-amino-4-deoxy-L-arabinose transferase-like glycosyltransferase
MFGGIGNHHIWPFDEAFVAEIAREMHVSGDLVVPALGGRPFLEKPPLHYAAIDAAYGLFGVTPFAARLPSALAASLALGVTSSAGGSSTAAWDYAPPCSCRPCISLRTPRTCA